MALARKNYAAVSPPLGPYVHAVKCNGVLYLSGLTALGTKAQNQGVAEQAREVFGKIAAIADAEGAGLEHLVKVTLFVTSIDGIDSLRQALFDIYDGSLPASSLVQVAGLFSPEVSIEVEAIVAIP